ncbi:MAG: ABC-F family ATP-binding cassette domain-containing protein [Lachnospiraceae bacterium]|nr:ABC-F family ATP-binding cassette domain-containing protein [Lachnospiraceae bacterium]
MIFSINNATVRFGADTVLNNIQFEIRNRDEKIAVVGRNGCGKTTLLKLIAGEIEPSGADGVLPNISSTGNPTIGYLKQLTFKDDSITLDEEINKVFAPIIRMKERLEELVILMNSTDYSSDAAYSAILRNEGYCDMTLKDHEELAGEYTALQEKFRDAGGYYYEKEYDTMLKKFGFCEEDRSRKLSDFSGGQRTKLAFIRQLLSKPDILLLDEPTNHLDISTVEWLETYLKSYNRAVVIVSHDRMFLDKITDTVYEIEHHRIKRYNGNYSAFVKLKREAYDKQLKDHNAQKKEIERLEGIAERFMGKPTKVSMAKSKLKAIEHMDIIEAPDRYDNKAFKAQFTPRIESGRDVLFVKDLKIGYDHPLAQLSFELKRGERLGITGGNGIGKSTLLKTLVDSVPALDGEYRYGTNVEIGYFDQQMAQYTSDKTVMDDFWDEYPSLTQTEVRNSLGAMLFSGDDVFKEVSKLSGGEKVRLALAKIFKKRPNMLILDEPTNHMDIVGKETLESMLADYPGTVIFVSHDRYFVKKTATKLLHMSEDKVVFYEFGYEQYEEEMAAESLGDDFTGDITRGKVISADVSSFGRSQSPAAKQEGSTDDEVRSGQQSYLEGKERARLEKKKKKLEEQIGEVEKEIDEKNEELSDPSNASDYVKLQDIQNEIDKLEEHLLELMAEWSM